MSDMPTSGGQGAAGEQPSEEEVRAYLEQLRGAPVDQVLAEVCSALINAAQVKVGRPDARVLLDAVGAVTDAVRGRADENLVTQLDDALTQLRLAQVDAEKEQAGAVQPDAAASTSDGAADAEAVGDSATPQAPSGGTAKRLWTPGT
ncbi:MAG: hypothetical protein WD377_02210 [Nitriliruptoraceae bacterium]